MTNKRKIIIPVLLAAIVILIAVLYYFSNRTHFNPSYTNGNTAGNLYNNGLFCEHNGTIYFSNPNDNHYLYSMSTDGSQVTRLYEDVVSYINADDHYVYYVRNNVGDDSQFSFLHINTNSLCRYDIRKGKVTVLDHDPSIYASLIGNYLYYIHYDTQTASTLYRVKIDGKEREQVDKNPYFTCSANGQYFYYNGIENDHNIYQLDTSTGSSHMLYEGNCWMPLATNDSIYFMDCEQNYALAKLELNADDAVLLTTDRIESFNVYGDYIYFQTNNLDGDAKFCRMNTDGSNYQVILEGNYKNINITSRYVYFSPYENESLVYQTPTGGDGTVSMFQP